MNVLTGFFLWHTRDRKAIKTIRTFI